MPASNFSEWKTLSIKSLPEQGDPNSHICLLEQSGFHNVKPQGGRGRGGLPKGKLTQRTFPWVEIFTRTVCVAQGSGI